MHLGGVADVVLVMVVMVAVWWWMSGRVGEVVSYTTALLVLATRQTTATTMHIHTLLAVPSTGKCSFFSSC